MPAKPRRNDPCPCGSGKKYKKCCINKEPPAPLRLLPPEWEETPSSPDLDADLADDADDRYLDEEEAEEREHDRPETEFDVWYDAYEASPVKDKLEMIRALLAQDRPAEYFGDNDFGGILLDLHGELGRSEDDRWISLIEHMRNTRRDVFNLDAAYFVNDLVYYYIGTGQSSIVNSLVESLVALGLPPTELTFELLDLLHVAGFHEAARMLVTDAVARIEEADLFEWSADELVAMAAFFPIHDYVEAGCPDAGLVKLRESLAAIDCTPEPDYLNRIIAHRAGRSDRNFTWEDFEGGNDPERTNLYLLTLEFGRWLATDRSMPAVAAEAMRHFVSECLTSVSDKKRRHSLLLPTSEIERHVTGMFNPISLQQTRGAATVVALGHFTEFLKTRGLIDERRYEDRSSSWGKLWSHVANTLDQSVHDYSFVTRW